MTNFNQFTRDFAEQPLSRTATLAQPLAGHARMSGAPGDANITYGNTTSKKMVYTHSTQMFNAMTSGEERPTSPIGAAKSKVPHNANNTVVPQTEINLVESGIKYNSPSPLRGFELNHHSKDRILNTTLQQKKFE